MNVIDIGIILILLMSFIIGFKKGAIKEACALIGIVLVFVISFILKEPLGNLLCRYLPFFHFKGEFTNVQSINIIIYQLIAFIIVFSILIAFYYTLLKVSKTIENLVELTIILLLPSKIIGGIISFITSYIIIFILLLVFIIPLKDQGLYSNSKFANYMLTKTPILAKCTSNITTAIEEISSLNNKNLDPQSKDLLTIDVMLKYNLVSKKTIVSLVETGKLTNISGLNNILDKYEK